jgi:glyoxylase-like metal-dependent hydrolase (beta-lactamase superfamily II)
MTYADRLAPGEPPDGLHLIDLPQSMTGFHHFICSWFFVDESGRRILVDPGPAGTIPLLLDKLSRITDGVDLVLLTHIHLDHSGGIGQLRERYGDVKVMAHHKARRHLTDPGKLWRSSLEVLGSVAEMYSAPVPLDADSLIDGDEIPGVTIIETPGHAPHHLSFFIPFNGKRLLFIGEAAGIHIPLPLPGPPYLRPTTPPKFDGDAARSSLNKIEQSLDDEDILCYAHWGISKHPREMIGMAGEQLAEWMSIIFEMKEEPAGVIAEHLTSRDPLLGRYRELPEDLRARELIFLKNSVTGFLKYFQESEEPLTRAADVN